MKEATKNIELKATRCVKIFEKNLVKNDSEEYNLGSDTCNQIYYSYLFTDKNKETYFYLMLEKKNFKLKEEIEAILNSVSLLDQHKPKA